MNKAFIPISIIVAGLIIGGAVFLTKKAENINTNVVQKEKPQIKVAPITNEDHIKGNPDAEILIVEYSDFECPFCSGFHGTMNRIMEEYGKDGKVAWVYRHSPLPKHKMATPAAEASECTAKLTSAEKFWDFADQIYANQTETLKTEKFKEIAVSLGANAEEFDKCVTERQTKDRVDRDLQDAMNIAKVDGEFGTPYNVMISKDGVQIPIMGNQPFASMKSMIDAMLVK